MKWMFFLYVGLSGMLLSCHEPKEGCLDNRAANYDVSADRNCCCDYPSLDLNISLEWDGLPFGARTVYRTNSDSIQFLEMKVLFSSFALYGEGKITRSDSVKMFDSSSGKLKVIDDFTWLSLEDDPLEVKNFVARGKYDSLQWVIGLHPVEILPESLESTHPLHPSKSGWSKEKGYRVLGMKWVTGDLWKDTVEVSFYQGSLPPLSTHIYNVIEVLPGQNTEVSLNLDMQRWFDGIDLKEPDVQFLYTRLASLIH